VGVHGQDVTCASALTDSGLVACQASELFVLWQGGHTGMNTDSVTFDMDRPTFEDQRAIDDYYTLNYDPATDDKPFGGGIAPDT
jgi:hypothetical protein